MPDKIIFLDIDGVLNRHDGGMNYYTLKVPRSGPHTLEKTIIETFVYYLNQLPDVKVVVSSSWRAMFAEPEDFCEAVGIPKNKMHDDWRTYSNGGDSGNGRAMDIQAWLFDHPDVDTYVILDDNDYKFDLTLGSGHFVHTDCKLGLTLFNLVDMIETLGFSIISTINGTIIIRTYT